MKRTARKQPVKNAATRKAMREARAAHRQERANSKPKKKPAAKGTTKKASKKKLPTLTDGRTRRILQYIRDEQNPGELVRANLNQRFGAEQIEVLDRDGLITQLVSGSHVGQMDLTASGKQRLDGEQNAGGAKASSSKKSDHPLRATWIEQAKAATGEQLQAVLDEVIGSWNAQPEDAIKKEIARAELERRQPKIPYHPLSQLLPMMSAEERTALRDSLKAHGQIDPIIRLDGQILDGRNRYEELLLLGIEPKFRDFDPKSDGDPVQFVIARATHRNMDDSQKACAAVKVKRALEGAAKERSKANLKQNASAGFEVGAYLTVYGERMVINARKSTSIHLVRASDPKKKSGYWMDLSDLKKVVGDADREPGSTSDASGRSRDVAGQYFGVSGRYVQDAEFLLDNAPELFDRVFNGTVPLSQAKREHQRSLKSADLAKKHRAVRNDRSAGQTFNVLCGDCLDEMRKIEKGSVRLIFTDSPYNEGIDYGRGAKADQLSDEAFLMFLEERIGAAVETLADDGTLCFMISGKYADQVGMMLRREQLHRRNAILWHETFGSYTDGNFTNCYRVIHYYTKHAKRFVFHGDPIRVPSDRQIKYNDARADADGKVPGNVWSEFPRLVDNAAERMPGFPTQLPLALVERIVLALSDPGDLILDPFNGSGTTGHAALLHGRKYLGIDLEAKNVEFSRLRLSAVVPLERSK